MLIYSNKRSSYCQMFRIMNRNKERLPHNHTIENRDLPFKGYNSLKELTSNWKASSAFGSISFCFRKGIKQVSPMITINWF